MLYQEILDVIKDVFYPEYTFVLENHNGTFLLSATYDEADINTGEIENQRTRKWFISEHACKSEIVQTCLKCILTSMEHRTREHFIYKGKLLFGPHWNVDTLANMADDTHTERRSHGK